MSTRVAWVLGALLAVGPAGVGRADLVPDGSEFQVNTYTVDSQVYPSIAALDDGGFMVVWSSFGSDSEPLSPSIQAQRFDTRATAVGPQFQVNTYTSDSQSLPEVAVLSGGFWVITWRSNGSAGTDTSSGSIQARLYDGGGQPLDADFQVNAYTANTQSWPDVAATADGGFVIVWESFGSSGSDDDSASIQARRFDAAGVPTGEEFQVNTVTEGTQSSPRVAGLAGGGFAVVWQSSPQFAEDARGVLFGSDGLPSRAEFQIQSTGYSGLFPALAATVDGGFAVTWEEFEASTGQGARLGARRFDSSGEPVGEILAVTEPLSEGFDGHPRVVALPTGGLLLIWERTHPPDRVRQAWARSFDDLGEPMAAPLRVDSLVGGKPSDIDADFLSDGSLVTTWVGLVSAGTDSSDKSIQGRGFWTLLFEDGFEGGDTSAWSATVP